MDVDGVPVRRKKTGEIRRHQSIIKTTLPACKACNNALDKRFEKNAKDPVRDLMGGRSTGFDGSTSEAFSLWALKTWLILAHPELKSSDPTEDQQRSGWDLNGLPARPWVDDKRGSATIGTPPLGVQARPTRRR